jgi:hypothetical protein
LFGGSEEDYRRLLDRQDFYEASRRIIRKKHNFFPKTVNL